LGIARDSRAVTYSANAPVWAPQTESPTRNRVTERPTASITPAKSVPSVIDDGLRSPVMNRPTTGSPRITCQSPALSETARTRTSTCESSGAGRSIVASCITWGDLYSQRIHVLIPLAGAVSFGAGQALSDRQYAIAPAPTATDDQHEEQPAM
jgi:hypothetical protein